MDKSTIKLLKSYDKSAKSLDMSNKNITGILDLEEFGNLEKLICSHNKITDITNFSIKLKYFDCSHNLIEELNGNQIKLNFEYLNCKKNPLAKLFYPYNIKPKLYPKTLRELKFGYEFNQSVDNLPNNIIDLEFGDNFNQPVDNLPNNVVNLIFGDSFNRSVDNLPNSIINLTFGCSFNKPVNNLPNNITNLSFGDNFNKSIDNLPNNIVNLSFGKNFKKSPANYPKNLTDLTIKNIENLTSIELPDKLINLTLDIDFDSFWDTNYFEPIFDCIKSTANLEKISFGQLFVSTGMTEFEGHMNLDKKTGKYIFDFKIYSEFMDDLLDAIDESIFNKKNSVINLVLGTYREDMFVSGCDCFAQTILEGKFNHFEYDEEQKENFDLVKSEYQNIVKNLYTNKYKNLDLNISFIYHYST